MNSSQGEIMRPRIVLGGASRELQLRRRQEVQKTGLHSIVGGKRRWKACEQILAMKG